jgi:hypothetical protein
MVPINLEEEQTNHFAKKNFYKVGSFPFKYPGIPLHYDKLRRKDIQSVVVVIFKRASSWRGRLLSYASRLSLLK